MTYRDIPIEAKPGGPRDPSGRVIETKPRTWKYLSEMSYSEFEATRKKRARADAGLGRFEALPDPTHKANEPIDE